MARPPGSIWGWMARVAPSAVMAAERNALSGRMTLRIAA